MVEKNNEELSESVKDIIEECEAIKDLLIAKNKAYGNSAFNPIRVFSRASTIEQLAVRIDDKLSRIARGKDTDIVPEDTVKDLIGYLVLYSIQKKKVEAQRRISTKIKKSSCPHEKE